MQIIEWSQFLKEGLPADAAMTIGVFDGVHRGHQALINRIVNHDSQTVPVIITFRENHKKGGSVEGDLLSFRQKASVFESMCVKTIVAADLTEPFRRIPGAEFLKLLRERGRMRFLAIGSNFRCGYQLDIDAAGIQKINAQEGIPTDIVEAVTESSLPVSSSRIRGAISEGKLDEAALMLGRPHCIDLRLSPSAEDGHHFTYTRSAINCVLPPPGTYTVMLQRKNGITAERSEIQIEEDTLRIRTGKLQDWDTIVFL